MHQKVYVDTSVLILLFKINQLNLLLLLYRNVYITEEIRVEYRDAIPNWILVESSSTETSENFDLDKGEASLINNVIKYKNSLLIIDDAKARRVAKKLNLNFIGTIGIIIKAKQLGYINKIKPLLEKMNLTNFRLAPDIQAKALLLAGE
jgi:predicted nucleic acid-binding protein